MELELLKRNLTEHEKWIESGATSGTRLCLCGITLSGIYLRNALLKRAQLQGIHLQSSDLSYANLEGAGLQESYLHRTNFYGARLQGASFRDARFSSTDLSHADLRGADLRGTDLRNARLTGTQLPEMTWLIYGEIYYVQVTNGQTLRVGCQEHPINDWRRFSEETVRMMDGEKAVKFYPRLMQIIDFCMGEGEKPEWVPPAPFNSQPPVCPQYAAGAI